MAVRTGSISLGALAISAASREMPFLGLVALDLPLERNLLADGFDRLGIGFGLDRAVDDRLQGLDRRLGQAFLHRVVDLFPIGVPRPGGGGIRFEGGHREKKESQRPTRPGQQSQSHDLILREKGDGTRV